MTQFSEPGFMSLQVSAKKLRENGYPFAVVIEDNQIRAFVVTSEVWGDIEASMGAGNSHWFDEHGYQPLVVLTKDFNETVQQMGWVMVGEV